MDRCGCLDCLRITRHLWPKKSSRAVVVGVRAVYYTLRITCARFAQCMVFGSFLRGFLGPFLDCFSGVCAMDDHNLGQAWSYTHSARDGEGPCHGRDGIYGFTLVGSGFGLLAIGEQSTHAVSGGLCPAPRSRRNLRQKTLSLRNGGAEIRGHRLSDI